MTDKQLMLARAVKTQGWPADLLTHLLSRCGAREADWRGLVSAGVVELRGGRYSLTKAGRRAYNKQKVGRYF
jgi:hypothetical protein